MGLKKTIRTLLDPDARLRAQLQDRRRSAAAVRAFPLTPEALLRGVDTSAIEAIRARFGIANPGIRVEKYIEFEKWLPTNIRRVLNTGLDFRQPARLLDLGSGAGYFVHLCKRLGHDPLGLDIPEAPAWYGDLFALFGIPRIMWRIDPFVPLPYLGGKKFDFVTAFQICFNSHHSSEVWKSPEWQFFLDDLQTRLNPGAILWLELNPVTDGGPFYTPELADFFRSRGALVDNERLIWGIQPREYRQLLDLARSEFAALKKTAENSPVAQGAATSETPKSL